MSQTVFVVMIEWNDPPSEVTGDPGLVGVYANKDAAEAAANAERARFDSEGEQVYQYTMREGKYCPCCGEEATPGVDCPCGGDERDVEPEWCEYCGAELTDSGDCNNDHDEWQIDLHVRECVVEGEAPATAGRMEL